MKNIVSITWIDHNNAKVEYDDNTNEYVIVDGLENLVKTYEDELEKHEQDSETYGFISTDLTERQRVLTGVLSTSDRPDPVVIPQSINYQTF